MTRFDHFVEEALYGQHGFYSTGQRAGSEGADFITSPETSTLFGACVAEYLDRLWQQLEPESLCRHRGRFRTRDAVQRHLHVRPRMFRCNSIRHG